MQDGTNSRVLRSGKNIAVSPGTPSAGATTSAETCTWSKGTGTRETDGEDGTHPAVVESNVEADDMGIDIPLRRDRVASAPGTVVNVPTRQAISHLDLLEAELAVQDAELARAQAASAAARSRLEIARVERANSSDAVPQFEESRLEGWVSEQRVVNRQAIADRPRTFPDFSRNARAPDAPSRPHADTAAARGNANDMSALADAIVQAVSLNRNQSNVPKFIHELPKFDGTIAEWMAFKSVFDDTKDMFSNIQNVARLRKALRGAAQESVRALLYTVTDPYDIIEALERRYGRPEMLILTELENVKRMPRLADDGRNLASFANKVANTVAAIKTLNQPQYLYSPELVNRVVEKLNLILKYKWFEFKSAHVGAPELILLSRFLNNIGDQCGGMFAYETARDERKSKNRTNHLTGERGHPPRSRTYSDSSDLESDVESEPRSRAVVANLKKRFVNKKPALKTQPKNSPSPNRPETSESKSIKCVVCSGNHTTAECADFSKLNVPDRWAAAKRFKLCFRCLDDNHRRPYRCRYVPCGLKGCEASHHRLLHGSDSKTPEHVKSNHGQVSSVNHVSQSNTYLKIIPVEIHGPLGTVTTHALLDEGSTMTLLERGVADEVVPRGRSESLSIEGVGGNVVNDPESCRVKLSIRGLCNRNYESMNAHTIDQLNLAPQKVDRELVMRCSHLIDIEDELCYDYAKPTVLIGQDNWHLITSRQLKIGKKDDPVASLTKLGWVLHGKDSLSGRDVARVNHIRVSERDDPALTLIREHFSIESLGVEPRRPKTDPNERALQILNSTCRKVGDRYEAGLLWRTDEEKMPLNKGQALHRLYNLESKLDKNTATKVEYTKQIENLIKNGHAEKVETTPTSPRSWYLPHFSVVHPQKGKIRVVFDAAARSGGKCLNDALLAGPDLLQSLFGVLIRFREGRIAVVADIKEMFLQIKVIEKDRDSLRFLWRGEDRTKAPQEYRMTSLIFGAASSPCIAIHVKNRNAENHGNQYPLVARATVRNFYMDDYLGAFDDEKVARQVVADMHKVHLNASFELRGWASNEPSVVNSVADTRSSDTTCLGKSEIERTLGLMWNHKRDTLSFNVNLRNTPPEVVRGEIPPTKRQVTSAVMSIFDPLGFVSPITVVGKALIQELWRSGIGWDDAVSPEHNEAWRSFISNLQCLKNLEVDRYVPATTSKEGELHTFVDASEKIYAAAVYFVSTNATNNRVARLVTGKARVAPLKPISIPRLELQAAVLGSRLADSVKRESDYTIKNCYYWSDSKTVLAWIKSDPRSYKSFVAHRLAEIENLSSPVDWRWVPSAENVADDATKGVPTEFGADHRWFCGAKFIVCDPETWPKEKPVAAPLPPSGEERVVKQVLVAHRQDSFLPDVARFSNYNKLLRATATVLLAAEVFKAKILKQKANTDVRNDQMKLAELLLARRSQHISFNEEIKRLEAGRPMQKNSTIRKIAVELKNGILYLDSRLKDERKRLPVLHAKEELTKKIIHHMHATLNHGNHHTVMNELQQKFHIVGLRGALRFIANKCQWCRTYRGTPHKVPIGDLPIERLTSNQPPFTAAAVDYFGPMHVTIGRRHEKRWGALYTCLTTRAVHVELAPSLSASSLILTLRRMMARRGTPTVLYSDNGTNMVGAEREIAEAIKSSDAQMIEFTNSKTIMWKKIPPGAPNMGGAWEILVRSIKAALKVTLKEKFPPEEILHTLLLEAEHIVNSRPLTPVNPNLEEEALTPNHFLIGRSNGIAPFGTFTDHQITPKSWKSAQHMADRFWSRWLIEYKPTLKTRQSHHTPQDNIKIGDIVLIVDQTMPRGAWPRGIVTSVFPGPDGRIRVTEVRTTAGLMRRPASRLIVIT